MPAPDPSFSHELLSLTVLSDGTELGFARKLNVVSEVAGLAGPGAAIEYNEAEARYDLTVSALNLSGSTPQAVAATGNGGEATTAAKSDHRHAQYVPLPSAILTATGAAALDVTTRINPTAGGFDVTLPTAVGNDGRRVRIKNVSASTETVNVEPTGGQTIDGVGSYAIEVGYEFLEIESDGANWMVVT
jgi:hypothetical protein